MNTAPVPPVQLRHYQVDQVEAAMRALLSGDDPLLVAATGTGKTTSLSEVARRIVETKGRVLVLAHLRELLFQLKERLELFGLKVGLELGRREAGNADVVVTSIQTMARRMDKFARDAFRLIIVDEAHHAASPSYLRVLNYFQTDASGKPNGTRVMGVTATPDRLDGASLGCVFEVEAARYDLPDAIGEGYLVPVRALRIDVEGLDLSSCRTRTFQNASGGEVTDLHPKDLGEQVIKPEAVEGVIAPLLQYSEGRKTLVFAVNVAHARALAKAINARAGEDTAFVIHGEMKKPEREAVLEHYKRGSFRILVNVNLMTEGVDVPSIGCIAMVRPTYSRTLYAQAVGRGLRLDPQNPSKGECILLDFVGNTGNHDLATPENSLAGALVGPVTEANPKKDKKKESKPRKRGSKGDYKPKGLVARFTVAVVEVIKWVGRRLAHDLRPSNSLAAKVHNHYKKKWNGKDE